MTGRREAETDRIFLLVHLRGGLADPQLRASNEGLPSILLQSRMERMRDEISYFTVS